MDMIGIKTAGRLIEIARSQKRIILPFGLFPAFYKGHLGMYFKSGMLLIIRMPAAFIIFDQRSYLPHQSGLFNSTKTVTFFAIMSGAYSMH